ncbi:hypothetical protein CLAIMM_14774 [Cladophialophora immunda]|nr:hypothetical protein CLAIMM_14774 [Cladophialophora immunda]
MKRSNDIASDCEASNGCRASNDGDLDNEALEFDDNALEAEAHEHTSTGFGDNPDATTSVWPPAPQFNCSDNAPIVEPDPMPYGRFLEMINNDGF